MKTGKSNLEAKLSRKATVVVLRLIDGKGFHTATNVDIYSSRLAKVLQEADPDVEGVSLTAVPLRVSIQMHCHYPSDKPLDFHEYDFNKTGLIIRHQRSFSSTTGLTSSRGWRPKRRQILLTMV